MLNNKRRKIDLDDNNTNLAASVACTPTSISCPNTITINGKKGKNVSFFVPDYKCNLQIILSQPVLLSLLLEAALRWILKN